MKIYSRSGDDGSTGTLGGDRTLKSEVLMEAVGTLDELNSHLGWWRVSWEDHEFIMEDELVAIQNTIFEIGSELVAAPGDNRFVAVGLDTHVFRLESSIDRMDGQVPPLRNFILPGGCESAARGHICRTICRRTERILVKLKQSHPVRPEILQYINRLSDWLFMASRYFNHIHGAIENIWEKK
ncbi:MAG: cob(I)yrinic acid a,c-diamide adenosyltransferase [Armatimonadetes bacterium]|nr:cob(I)yrinic acid a,c-diamide adenosyltransferase [Armatimonadota bacterium]